MKYLFQVLVFTAASLSVSCCDAQPQIGDQPPELPNIVLFFIDDLGYTDLGCYGSTFYDTPNIDGLAERSVRFTDFYSASPVCSPTRAALMTGKAPQRMGITQWINQPSDLHLPLDEVTIGEALGSAGYKSGYIGKWHLGEKDNQQPSEQGFVWMKSVNRAGAPGSYFFPYVRKNKKKKIKYWDVPDLDDGQEGDYLNDAITDHALSFISQSKDQPFFLCFAHYAVHTPIQAPEKLIQRYQEKAGQVPTVAPEFIEERNGAKTRPLQNDPAYAAMTNNLDTNVGRVLDHLESLGLTKNTIVVFTSDNGGLSTLAKKVGPTSTRPLRGGKGWTYEGGIRIPTMISWPEKIKPSVNSTPAITMDLYPTLLELTGQKLRPKQHLDGCSLVSAIKGSAEDELENRFLAWTYPHQHGSGHSPSNAIRAGAWKLIQLADEKTDPGDRFELYNLHDDLGEQQNLAVEHHDKTHELAGYLAQWLEDTALAVAPEKEPATSNR